MNSTTKDEILNNNLTYTLTSWSKQKGLKPLNIKNAKGIFVLYKETCRKMPKYSGD